MKKILTGKVGRQGGPSAGKLRWLPSALAILTVAGLCSLAAPAAKADTWNFSLTDPGSNNISFSFDTNAPTSGVDTEWFVIDSPVDWFLNGVDQGGTELSFWNAIQGGGMWLGQEGSILNLWGQQLYSGSELAPTFLPGTYAFDNTGPTLTGPISLTFVDPVDPVATPEPSSMLLFGAGLLAMLGLAAYQSRRTRTVVPELS